MTSNPSNRVRFGPYEVDLHTHELWKFGTRMKLVGQPFEILAVLLSRAGELVTRDELRGRLWPSDTFIDFNHGLNAAVNKLREALSDSAESPRYIETLPRRGYRFIAKVEWVEAGAAVPAEQRVLSASPIEPQRWPEVTSKREAKILPTSTHNAWSGYFMGAGLLFTLLIFAALAIRTVSTLGEASAARAVVEHTRPLLAISDSSTPAFSPDGNSVAFYRDGPDANHSGIYVAPVGSDQVNQLTGGGDDCCPVWSPDRRWIAFSRVYNHEYSIHIVPADAGSGKRVEADNTLAAQTAVPTIEKVALEAVQKAHAIARELNTGGVVPAGEKSTGRLTAKTLRLLGQMAFTCLRSTHQERAELPKRLRSHRTGARASLPMAGPCFSFATSRRIFRTRSSRFLCMAATGVISCPSEVESAARRSGRSMAKPLFSLQIEQGTRISGELPSTTPLRLFSCRRRDRPLGILPSRTEAIGWLSSA